MVGADLGGTACDDPGQRVRSKLQPASFAFSQAVACACKGCNFVPGQTRATPPTGELTYTEYRNDQWHFETDIPSDLITTSAPQKKKSTGTGMPALHY